MRIAPAGLSFCGLSKNFDSEGICGGLSIGFPIAIYLKCASILINRYRKWDPKGRWLPLALLKKPG